MTSSTRPMQHIDRKALYTNLSSRIEYLHTFLDFSTNDINALIAGSKYIKALIPAVVNILYKKLVQYDITAIAFITRSTATAPQGGHIDVAQNLASLGEDSPQILHRKRFMRAYLAKLCSDPRDPAFWEYLDKVGMMHVGLGRSHPLHVEYVHIGAALAVVHDVLTEAILSHPRLPLPQKMAIVKALGKVIWIQNDLFAKWYVRDGEEFTDGVDYGEIEKEGWLKGRKVLREEDTESSASDETVGATARTSSGVQAAGVCPFSGLPKPTQSVESTCPPVV